MKIKSISLLLLAITLFSVNSFVAVAETNETYKIQIIDGEQVLYDSINKITYLKAFTPDGTEIPIDEYKLLLEKSRNPLSSDFRVPNQDDDILPLDVVSLVKYQETQKWSELMNPKKATPTTDCRNSAAPCSIKLEQGISNTEEFSVGVETIEIPVIRSSASFTWTKSAISTTTIGTDLTVPKGKKGYLTWAPKFNFTKGNLKHYVTLPGGDFRLVKEKKGEWGASPALTPATGFADGIIAIVIEN